MGAVKELLYAQEEEMFPWEEPMPAEMTGSVASTEVSDIEKEKQEMIKLSREVVHLKAQVDAKEQKLKSWMEARGIKKLPIDEKKAFAFVTSESYLVPPKGLRNFVALLRKMGKDPCQYLKLNKKEIMEVKKELGWTEEKMIEFLKIQKRKTTKFTLVNN